MAAQVTETKDNISQQVASNKDYLKWIKDSPQGEKFFLINGRTWSLSWANGNAILSSTFFDKLKGQDNTVSITYTISPNGDVLNWRSGVTLQGLKDKKIEAKDIFPLLRKKNENAYKKENPRNLPVVCESLAKLSKLDGYNRTTLEQLAKAQGIKLEHCPDVTPRE